MLMCSLLKHHPFWFRCMYMLIWGKFVLYKYVTCWLVTVSREDKSYLDKLGVGLGEWSDKNPKPSLPSGRSVHFVGAGL